MPSSAPLYRSSARSCVKHSTFAPARACSLPPPAGAKSPALWGTKARIDEMFGPQASGIQTTRRNFVFRYRSPEHFIDIFKTYYGPVLKAFAALDAAKQDGLKRDMLALIATMNRSEDDTMVVPSEYLEVVVTTR